MCACLVLTAYKLYIYNHFISQHNTVDNCTDGMFQGTEYFVSQPGKGKFVKVLELQPDERYPIDTTAVIPKHSFEVGSMVQFGDPKEYGKVIWIGWSPDEAEEFARVLAVRCMYTHTGP